MSWNELRPEGNGGKLLRLKDKNQRVRIRFVGLPVKLASEYNGKPTTRWACKVIHKTVDSEGRLEKSAKCFVFSPMIYYAIGDLIKDPDWGPCENYDVEITRTEESTAAYYQVIPKPNGKPLTDEEREMAKQLDVELANPFGTDKASNMTPAGEYDPFEDG